MCYSAFLWIAEELQMINKDNFYYADFYGHIFVHR